MDYEHGAATRKSNLKKLDEKALIEFRETKKQIQEIAQKKIIDHENNKLVSYYQAFSELPNNQLGLILAHESMQKKYENSIILF